MKNSRDSIQEDLFENPEYLSVSGLNQLIRDVLNMGFPNAVWVCGEIQGYDRSKDKKHVFFELCEKDPETKDILARVGMVIFAGKKNQILEILKHAENAFDLKDDIEVKFLCRIDFYPPHGAVRLIVESVDPVYTLGKIAQEKQKLIAKLKARGVLEKNKTVELSPVPLKIGLVTAVDSAAYNDFLSELRSSGYGFQIHCRNTLMQGKGAETDVCRALDDLRRLPDLDAIVITRGGGSIADLSCFNSEKIAEKIASLELPVLCGIGHEIDITVTDLAAHTYQKTPTAIAKFFVERTMAFVAEAEEKLTAVFRFAEDKIEQEKNVLKHKALEFQGSIHSFLKASHQKIFQVKEAFRLRPLKYVRTAADKALRVRENFLRTIQNKVRQEQTRISHFVRMVEIVHPSSTLKRGFSITRTKDGKLVRKAQDVKIGGWIETQLSAGRITSRVEK